MNSDQEKTDRILADNELEIKISNEKADRVEAITSVVMDYQGKINKENSERILGDNELKIKISDEKADRVETITSVVMDYEVKINQEKTDRILNDNEIKIDLSNESVKRAENISDISVDYYENKADNFDKMLELESKIMTLEKKIVGTSIDSNTKSLENRLEVIEQTLSNMSAKILKIEHEIKHNKNHV